MPKPEIVFRHGPCSAAVFHNERQGGDQTFSTKTVAFQKRYRDKEGEWQATSSLHVNDIPKALLVLHKAYDYLTGADIGEDPDQAQTDDATRRRSNGRAHPSTKPPAEDDDPKVAERQRNAIVNLLRQMDIDSDEESTAFRGARPIASAGKPEDLLKSMQNLGFGEDLPDHK